MENTVAFAELMNLISVIGAFVNTPIFFGLSFLQILVIVFIFNHVIGVLLGGIAPRSLKGNNSGEVREVSSRDGAKETYIGGGKY